MPETTKLQLIRQGDLLFVPIDPEDYKWALQHYAPKSDGIIREGEATGHHHRLAEGSDAVLLTNWRNDALLRVGDGEATVVHEEHGPVTLPKGTHEVHVAREYDYMAKLIRSVRD